MNCQNYTANTPQKFAETPALEAIHQLLTYYIGPIASFLVAESLDVDPEMSFEDLIEHLCEEIPDSALATTFREDAQSHYSRLLS